MHCVVLLVIKGFADLPWLVVTADACIHKVYFPAVQKMFPVHTALIVISPRAFFPLKLLP